MLLPSHTSTSCFVFSFEVNPLMGPRDLELSMDYHRNLIAAVKFSFLVLKALL